MAALKQSATVLFVLCLGIAWGWIATHYIIPFYDELMHPSQVTLIQLGKFVIAAIVAGFLWALVAKIIAWRGDWDAIRRDFKW